MSKDAQPKYDHIVDPIREARHQISEQFGHDPERLVAHYIARQKRYDAERLIWRSDAEASQGEPAPSDEAP